MTRSLLAASILVAATLAPAAAGASEFDYRGKRVVTDSVNIADLDLSTTDGMDRLIRRVRARIDDMCEWDSDCRDEAWLSADWQVARAAERDQWRTRVDYERMADRRDYRLGGTGRRTFELRRGGPGADFDAGSPSPRVDYAPPPSGAPVSKTTTVTTQTFTVRTTTVTLSYRLPPEGAWKPRCSCDR